MSEDDIDKYLNTGTKVAFKINASEATTLHKLTVPHDVDEVWLEGKMGKPNVLMGGEIRVKIIFKLPSKIRIEVDCHDAIQAAKDYISKSNDDQLYMENVGLRFLLPWTTADGTASGVPWKEEIRSAFIVKYCPVFRQYTFKFHCGYERHASREQGMIYIADSSGWRNSVDTSTQQRVQAADAEFTMFDRNLQHCISKGINVSSDAARRIMVMPDIPLDYLEKRLSQDDSNRPKGSRKLTDRYMDKKPEQTKKKPRCEASSSSHMDEDGSEEHVETVGDREDWIFTDGNSASTVPEVPVLNPDQLKRLCARIEDDKNLHPDLDPDWFTIADDLELPDLSVEHYGPEMWLGHTIVDRLILTRWTHYWDTLLLSR
jgi:hypothetical protein